MSYNFTKIEKKIFSNEPSDLDENEVDNDNSDEEKINQINNYKFNNNLSSLVNLNIKDNDENSLKSSKDKLKYNLDNNDNKNEQIEQQNIINEVIPLFQDEANNKNNETQFYELTTNGLVEKIKNDYEDIYMNQQNDINKFVEKLAEENSELKLEISKLKTEIIKLQIKNDLNSNFYFQQKENVNKSPKKNLVNREIEITSEKIELEKKNIKEEYDYILNNISSYLITKNVKSLYDKLIQSKNDLFNCQKIILMLQEENEKLKIENDRFKSIVIEEKNKIIEKIIEIQTKTNSDIDSNKDLLVPIYDNFSFRNKMDKIQENQNEINSESDKLNNVYLYYIEKIKNLTYEKDKLLTCNYDFFIKINDLSQTIEGKNNIINEQLKKISSSELKILNLEQQIKSLNIINKETSNQFKEAQEKINELSLEKIGNVVFEEKTLDNKKTITRRQQENKISQLNQSLDELTTKYSILNKNYTELKEKNEKLTNDSLLKNGQIDKIIKEKNQMIQDINNLKMDLKLKEEQMKTNMNEYENRIKYIKENKENDNHKETNNNIDLEQILLLINDIYNKIENNLKNNILNNNISLFVKNNINEIAKLKEINKQMNLLYKNQEINTLLIVENEKLKNHIKEIINLTLEKTNITYIEKFKEDFVNISLEQLILKIINYIKVYKVCFLLQKIKTAVNYCEKYINWLNEKDLYKSSNPSLEELKSEINDTNEEINYIKDTLKNNSLEFESKIKNFLSKDEIKLEINDIQKKYEKIITDIFEYFLKYKTTNSREYENKEILTLQIPIKTYNLMIENNMNNLSLISQSIESWNLYVNNDLNENNDNVFQEIINMTNINNDLEYNNISDIIVNNNIENKEKIENNENNENNDSQNNKYDNVNGLNISFEENKKENEVESVGDNSENESKENNSQNSLEEKE